MTQYLRYLRLLALALAWGGCLNLSTNEIAITYDLDPQEFAPPDFGSQMGTVPDVSCATGAQTFSALPAPQGTRAACDAATKKCVLLADVTLTQKVDLSTQKDFPSQVANSGVINHVEVR